ncbi:MAG: preprotein translocase subunit SecG [Candidatus Promineifilaceae bacterium]|jgi:preprotein translocase subunit SecG
MINTLIYILLVLEVIVCFMLLAVILVQRSKSQGAGMAFGAGMGETMFGSQVGNILTRSTVILGITFLVITTALAYLTPKATGRGATDLAPDVNPVQQQQQPPPVSSALPTGDGSFPTPTETTAPTDVTFPTVTPEAAAPAVEVAPVEATSAPVAEAAPAEVAPVEVAPVEVTPEAVPKPAE